MPGNNATVPSWQLANSGGTPAPHLVSVSEALSATGSPMGLQGLDPMQEGFLAPTISSKRLPQMVPDQPAETTPRIQSGADFDTVLENALKDLRITLLCAHKRELGQLGQKREFGHSDHGQKLELAPKKEPGQNERMQQRPDHQIIAIDVDKELEILHPETRKPLEAMGAAGSSQSESVPAPVEVVTHEPAPPTSKILPKKLRSMVTIESEKLTPPPSHALSKNHSFVGSGRGSMDISSHRSSMDVSGSKSGTLRKSENRTSVTGVVTELREAVFKKQLHRMQSALADQRVMVNRHLLKQRLCLENNLVIGSWKLIRWLICFVPLLVALTVFEPGTDIGSVHDMLIEHYGLDHTSLLALKEWDHVYSFFKKFKEANDLLEPTGKVFWCDPRYLDALGLKPAGIAEFERQQQLSTGGSSGGRRLQEGDHSGLDQKDDSDIIGRLRRLSTSTSSSSSSSSSTSTASLEAILLGLKHVYQNPTPLGKDLHGHDRLLYDCVIPTDSQLLDIHTKLEQARQGNVTITSTRRRRTDGFGPQDDYKTYFPQEFNNTYLAYLDHKYVNVTQEPTGTYLSRYHYPYGAVSLFDPVVYQARYALKECKSGTFASYFATQAYNKMSTVFGLNAPKAVDILECVDFSEHVHDPIAADIDTDRYTYQGKHIYARLAATSGDHTGPDFSDWQRIGWLGKQTEIASISVLIYIDGLEMFTSLAVHFTQDSGGALSVERNIASVVELDDRGVELQFHLACLVSGFCSIVCLMYDLSNCRRLRRDNKRLDSSCLFEVAARFMILSFAVALEILYVLRKPMRVLYEDAFETFLYRTDFSHTGLHNAMQHFFEVKEQVHATDQKHVAVKIIGTIVYGAQVVQLILLLGAHPRVDLLCATIVKQINGLAHYVLMFVVIFGLLGYYAHWMFSSTLPNLFGSTGSSIMKQTEMIVGYADAWPWEEIRLMNRTEFYCFVMYLVTYFGLVFMVLLNFFIAIILEGFFGVWKSLTEDNAGGAGQWLPIDVWHSWKGSFMHRRKKWPNRIDLIARIETFENEQRSWESFHGKRQYTQLLSAVILEQEYGFKDEESALEFLSNYALKAPLILDLKPGHTHMDSSTGIGGLKSSDFSSGRGSDAEASVFSSQVTDENEAAPQTSLLGFDSSLRPPVPEAAIGVMTGHHG